MTFELIGIGILLAASVAYLIRHFIQQAKAHDCDDCGLMKLHKENKKQNAESNG